VPLVEEDTEEEVMLRLCFFVAIMAVVACDAREGGASSPLLMLLSVRLGSTAAAAEEEDALILFARTTIEVAGRSKARKSRGEFRKRAGSTRPAQEGGTGRVGGEERREGTPGTHESAFESTL